MKKDIGFLKDNLIAHRGYHNIEKGIPENSKKAFSEAINKKLTIELDIHITKDDKIVVFHDHSLFRMTGVDSIIEDLDYSDIKKLRLLKTNERIPLFKEVLKQVDGKVPLLIEFKASKRYKLLVDKAMEFLKTYKGEYAIQSFNPFLLLYIKKNYPNIIRGQLSSDFNNKKMGIIKKYLYKNMFFNLLSKPDFIAYDVRAIPNKKLKRERKNRLVLGWTIKSQKYLEKYNNYCDNFICENIDVSDNINMGVIFDLDGTLWDSTKATISAVNKISKEKNIKPVTDKDIINSFGHNKENIAKIYFPNVSRNKALDLVDDVNITNINILQEEGGVLYPDLDEVIKKLSKNYSLFVVSNAIRNEYIEAFLETSKLGKYFTGYLAAGSLGIDKDKAIKKVIKDYNLDKSLYIGDTKIDYEASKKAGIPFIHARYGFQKDLDSKYHINDLEELGERIEEVFKGEEYE